MSNYTKPQRQDAKPKFTYQPRTVEQIKKQLEKLPAWAIHRDQVRADRAAKVEARKATGSNRG